MSLSPVIFFSSNRNSILSSKYFICESTTNITASVSASSLSNTLRLKATKERWPATVYTL